MATGRINTGVLFRHLLLAGVFLKSQLLLFQKVLGAELEVFVGVVGCPCLELFGGEAGGEAHEKQDVGSEGVDEIVFDEQFLKCIAKGIDARVVSSCFTKDLHGRAKRHVIVQDSHERLFF